VAADGDIFSFGDAPGQPEGSEAAGLDVNAPQPPPLRQAGGEVAAVAASPEAAAAGDPGVGRLPETRGWARRRAPSPGTT
jgi:hypothetical protein